MPSWGLSAQEQDEVWARWRRGESLRLIAPPAGQTGTFGARLRAPTGGVQWHPPRGPQRCLTIAEREEISRGVAAGEPGRQIAARLGRAPSTVSRELARNGGRSRYRVQVVVEVGFAAGERRGRRQADVKGKRPSRYGGWAAWGGSCWRQWVAGQHGHTRS
jgi:hypothetical protein